MTSVLLAAALAGCGQAAPDQETKLAPAVEALPARRGTLPLAERLSGVVRADNQIAVRAEIEAPILQVLVRNGEPVKQGQPLVRLEGDALQEQVRQAEAALQLTEAQAEEALARIDEVEAQVVRTRALAREELVSPLDLETQEAQLAAVRASARQSAARVEQARATLAERRSALGKTLLRAPIAGRVGQRNAEVGMLAGPGDVLFVLGDLSDLIVEVPLTEEMLRSLRVGQRATLRSPSLGGATLAGTLARISPFLEASSFSTLGEIEVEAGGQEALRPGMFVTVEVHYGESREATLVPASALWEDPRTGVRGVFVVTETAGLAPTTPAKAAVDEVPQEPRNVKFRPVEVLADGRATVGVGGVEEGDWVVTVGQHLLARDGDATARVRATTWDRVLELQDLQREDLLQSFLDRQQEWARTRGAEPPTNEEFLRRQGG